MPLNDPRAQANPSEPQDFELEAYRAAVARRVQALETHRAVIVRWFWRALAALNLVIGTGVLWLALGRLVVRWL